MSILDLLSNKSLFLSSNGKLANCQSKNPDECELFIVEGDYTLFLYLNTFL